MIDDDTLRILEKHNFRWKVLNYIPYELINDAIQEAIIAALEGKSPSNAVRNYWAREQLHRQRERNNQNELS
jgi:hypothetical protein